MSGNPITILNPDSKISFSSAPLLSELKSLFPNLNPHRVMIDIGTMILFTSGNDYLPGLRRGDLEGMWFCFSAYMKSVNDSEARLSSTPSDSMYLTSLNHNSGAYINLIVLREMLKNIDFRVKNNHSNDEISNEVYDECKILNFGDKFGVNTPEKCSSASLRQYFGKLNWNLRMYMDGSCTDYRSYAMHVISPSVFAILDWDVDNNNILDLPKTSPPLTPLLCAIAVRFNFFCCCKNILMRIMHLIRCYLHRTTI